MISIAAPLSTFGRLWNSAALTVILITFYPAIFTVSQNWYALNFWQNLWLLIVALVAGAVVVALVHSASLLIGHKPSAIDAGPVDPARSIGMGLLCAGIAFFLLIAPLKSAVPQRTLLILLYFLVAAVFGWLFRCGAQRSLNSFLAILSALASLSWAIGASSAPPEVITGARPDFERASFRDKPNIYLFIYDAYGSKDAYEKVFNFDNGRHYKDLEERGFRVIHTFSNYSSTWATTVGTFLGQHHYYETSTGNFDSQSGRPMMAGLIHNPILSTLRKNGYRLQYIHQIDYFVNELGVLEFVYPVPTALSALRAFGNPTLSSIAGRKRRVSLKAQKQVLFERIARAPDQAGAPWFTFAHVNIPAHAPAGGHWTRLGEFEQVFRDRTVQANEHMLETVDRIKAKDPNALIVIFGDHGAWRYSRIWGTGDPNKNIRDAGVPTEIVTLDRAGIMIAIHSGGACDDYAYDGMTPVNMMRVVFACLAGDRELLEGKAQDISLFRPHRSDLWLIAKDGLALPSWQLFQPAR